MGKESYVRSSPGPSVETGYQGKPCLQPKPGYLLEFSLSSTPSVLTYTKTLPCTLPDS